MSTIITGDASQAVLKSAVSINGATNATPIVISTSTAHGFYTGDPILISGVGGNTAANSIVPWTITVLDSTHFRLNGSVGSGAYTSGGTATDLYFTPSFTIPSDGDAFNVASINVAIEMLANRSQKLALLMAALGMSVKSWSSSASWVAPSNVLPFGFLIHWGGGGAGGNGAAGPTAANFAATGGGGGGGAQLCYSIVALNPNATYTIVIGAGGATANAAGSDTTWADGVGVKARARGGGGGASGTNTNVFDNTSAATSMWTYAEGGAAVQQIGGTAQVITQLGSLPATAQNQTPFGQGGIGAGMWNLGSVGSSSYARNGASNQYGNIGGAGGVSGTSSGTTRPAGGGGGGGAAGPGGAGGAGGAGGNGNSTTATAGANGTAGAANTGSGGGGGGAGGCGPNGPAGGTFAAGGSGMSTLIYFGNPT